MIWPARALNAGSPIMVAEQRVLQRYQQHHRGRPHFAAKLHHLSTPHPVIPNFTNVGHRWFEQHFLLLLLIGDKSFVKC